MDSKSETSLMIFCKKVAFLRALFQLSEAEMADIMGISVRTLRRLERCDSPSRLGIDVLIKLNAYFKLRPSAFFTKLYPEE